MMMLPNLLPSMKADLGIDAGEPAMIDLLRRCLSGWRFDAFCLVSC
jgi:hypothetical protein